MFLTLMVVGLVGLLIMALPALGGRGHGHGPGHVHVHGGAAGSHGAHGALSSHTGPAGHAGPALQTGHGHGLGTAAHAHAPPSQQGLASGAGGRELLPAVASHAGLWSWLPSPRALFSVLALYGASGNALVHAGHLSGRAAAFVALLPAFAVERFVVRPVWNLVFRFHADASSPLAALVSAEAHAVVPFRNGRGLVSTVRDGRLIQLTAEMRPDQVSLPVRVGDRLRIDHVDPQRERVVVSLFS